METRVMVVLSAVNELKDKVICNISVLLNMNVKV